ncbi:hypothetical protein AYL99_06648 [Fonsecaea erecta]|uniref:protein-ribulosamine 3-kinase n=1 Tax=Fonsecaea erecta TaxID=1367422 RepID=A0A178ZHU0_9EURO|nr:hypothetical protein AYL99_06648 [Fonsecaea erecta]OAP59350.1 hypothetical protein AYL99_06648 [Fonsecaea erecta]
MADCSLEGGTDLPGRNGSTFISRARSIVAGLKDPSLESYIQYVDSNVAACEYLDSPIARTCLDFEDFPLGSKVKGIFAHGSASWTRTAAIQTVQVDGTILEFFLKVTRTTVGKTTLQGEYVSTWAISRAAPDLVQTPIAVGTYATDNNIHFLLSRFVNMTGKVPDPRSLPMKIAEMHFKGASPTGKYGFPVPTSMGACIQQNKWTSSWERCFTELMNTMFEFEQDVHGNHEEMQQLHHIILEKVIPRLLRPMETGGRDIEPRIVHGDLWDGNTSVEATTGNPVIFDASSIYAHNEYELGPWDLSRHRLDRSYIQEYRKHFEPSRPEEDFEDRLILYRLRFNLTSSACHLDHVHYRKLAVGDMRYLTAKYTDGYQGPEQRKPEEDQTLPSHAGEKNGDLLIVDTEPQGELHGLVVEQRFEDKTEFPG